MSVKRRKADFPNAEGKRLAALLELPAGKPEAVALFAHCFTCGKDIAAASRISRALAGRGIAVLRFDFTGLGSSDGDFANTGFSSNVEDLVSAAEYLRADYMAPSILIGHSLGGAAVLAAAGRIPEVRAVVTIGAPSSPDHVLKHFGESRDKILEQGEACVELGGRRFNIASGFIRDMEAQSLDEHIRGLRSALLVMHSPVDATVSVEEAAHIYTMAKHPKSFISLDDADHLLTRKADADYVAATITAWASRYLLAGDDGREDKRTAPGSGQVEVLERNHSFLRDILTDDHFLQADEPLSAGGSNVAPDPYELLLASLGACTSMTVRMYANHKDWPLDDVRVSLSHSREHVRDCEDCPEKDSKVDVLERRITLEGDLDEAQRARLIEIANRCPVHRTLLNLHEIRTTESG